MKQFILLILLCILTIINTFAQQITRANISNSFEILTIHKSLNTPAEDIYNGVWNNNYVNCYHNIDIENNYEIHLTKFSMPIKTQHIQINSHFGYRPKFKRYHKGIDLNLCIGDTIYATFSGKVRISNYDHKGFGNYVVIRHFNGLETIYAHMSRLLVKNNEYVYVGQPIGIGGSTGRSTGPHLHLEVRFCGIPIDPIKIFDFKYQDVTGDTYIFCRK